MNVVKQAVLGTITSPMARSFAAPAAIGFVGGTITGAAQEHGLDAAWAPAGFTTGLFTGRYITRTGLVSNAPTAGASAARSGAAVVGMTSGAYLGWQLGSRIS